MSERLKTRSRTLSGWCLFLGLATLIAASDLWTKDVVFAALKVESVGDPPRVVNQERIDVIPGFFQFEANYNYGAFSGWFSEHTGWLTVLSVVALVIITAIVFYSLRQPRPPPWPFVAALGLIAGGTAGNLYDRAVLAAVRDWIKWFYKDHVWPNFNIADSGICVGVVTLLLLEVRSAVVERRKRRSEEAVSPSV